MNTNHFASDEMRGCFAPVDPPQARGRSLGRYETVSVPLLTPTAGSMWLSLRGWRPHDGPLSSICCHPEADTNVTTISASIFLPRQRQMLFCHGFPARGDLTCSL